MNANSHQTPREPHWVGPLAFNGIAGNPGAEREFGTRWGERCDQRIAMRCMPSASHGLLYAYDPLWDEYAVLARNAPVAAVEAAFNQALAIDIHMHVLEFAELVRCHQILSSGTVAQHDRDLDLQPRIGR